MNPKLILNDNIIIELILNKFGDIYQINFKNDEVFHLIYNYFILKKSFTGYFIERSGDISKSVKITLDNNLISNDDNIINVIAFDIVIYALKQVYGFRYILNSIFFKFYNLDLSQIDHDPRPYYKIGKVCRKIKTNGKYYNLFNGTDAKLHYILKE